MARSNVLQVNDVAPSSKLGGQTRKAALFTQPDVVVVQQGPQSAPVPSVDSGKPLTYAAAAISSPLVDTHRKSDFRLHQVPPGTSNSSWITVATPPATPPDYPSGGTLKAQLALLTSQVNQFAASHNELSAHFANLKFALQAGQTPTV